MNDISERRQMGEVDNSFYLVGVGASAGGLEAIKKLIGGLPPTYPHSFVIVQHLSPDFKSMMGDILSRETKLNVVEVEDDMPVEPGHVYLIPPKWNVVIQGTNVDSRFATGPHAASFDGLRFSLIHRSAHEKINYPIDLFFQSLAEAAKQRSACIILSGTGTDGSRGLRAVKDNGGLVIAQHPDTADFDGMPNAAIATKLVDIIAPPGEMIEELVRYFEDVDTGPKESLKVFDDAEKLYDELIQRISSHVDIDFSQYKEGTLKRRMSRRINLTRCRNMEEYLHFIDSDEEELARLAQDFLVGSTEFFRDIPAWQDFEEEVLPLLFKSDNLDEPLKVWSIGCSTGEEAYSLALSLELYRREHHIERDFKVIATDVNGRVLEHARRGVYATLHTRGIPEKYLIPGLIEVTDDTIRFGTEIKRKIVFAKHNALIDPPYIRTDLVVCRNVLIYLTQDLQKQIFDMMSFSLRRDGILFLGAAEHIARGATGILPLVQRSRIFRNDSKVPNGSLRNYLHSQFSLKTAGQTARMGIAGDQSRSRRHVPEHLVQTIVAQLQGGAFVLGENGQVLKTFGAYRDFLKLPDSAFSANIVDLLPSGVSNSIMLLMRRAMSGEASSRDGLIFEIDGKGRSVTATCEAVSWYEAEPTILLVLSHRQPVPEVAQGTSAPNDQEKDELIRQLEDDIRDLKDLLASTTEELNIVNEEVQTANEELVTANEELQASNEELQSTNEELHTVNSENSARIRELEAAYDDIENLLDNADFAIIFLDRELCIRRFSKGLAKFIDLMPSDVGRKLSNFTSNLSHEAMERLHMSCQEVLDTEAPVSTYLSDGKDGQIFLSAQPFLSKKGEIDGVALKLFDTGEIEELRKEVKRQRDQMEGLIEAESAGYWDWHILENYHFMSPRFKSMFGYAENEIENSPEAWRRLIHPEDLPKTQTSFDAHVASKGSVPYDNEVRFFHKDGSIVWVICRGRVVEWSKDGAPLRMTGVHIDISALKRREEEIREVRRYAFIAAHDLMQPTNTVINSLSALTEEDGIKLSEEQEHILSMGTVAANRLQSRISALLDYSRLEKKELPFDEMDLNAVVEECLNDMAAQIDESAAEITVDELPKAFGATTLIAQVIYNILGNAMKYRRQDVPCRIKVSGEKTDDGMVRLTLADNGIGIPAEHRQSVFNMFTRLHSEEDFSGNGLGLSLCERLIVRHGGRIWLQDGLDGGIAVVFNLKQVPNA